MIQLGENIELTGFDELDRNTMVIVKKFVGNYLRTYLEKAKEGSLKLELKQENQEYLINAEFISKQTTKKATAKGNNLFFSLSNALSNLEKEL